MLGAVSWWFRLLYASAFVLNPSAHLGQNYYWLVIHSGYVLGAVISNPEWSTFQSEAVNMQVSRVDHPTLETLVQELQSWRMSQMKGIREREFRLTGLQEHSYDGEGPKRRQKECHS